MIEPKEMSEEDIDRYDGMLRLLYTENYTESVEARLVHTVRRLRSYMTEALKAEEATRKGYKVK